MKLTKLMLAAAFASCLASAHAAAQPSGCRLGLEKAPELRGFRLGMSLDKVKTRFPDVGVTPGEFGQSRFDLNGANIRAAGPATSEGVNQLSLNFLDERVVGVSVHYSGVEWQNLGQFTSKISEAFNLPDAWKRGAGGDASLDSGAFRLKAFRTSVSSVLLELSDPSAGETVQRRTEEQKERRRQAFRP